MARAAIGRPGTVYAASEGDKFNSDTTLTVVSCATCHITYAIPDSLYKSAQKYPGSTDRGWKLCCPLGHTWWYTGKTEEAKLRDRLKHERERSARLAAQRDQAQAEARGQKAAKTRIKNSRERERQRVANGVCPVCTRTFKNLARHMHGQHPGHAHHGEPS